MEWNGMEWCVGVERKEGVGDLSAGEWGVARCFEIMVRVLWILACFAFALL